MLFVGTGTYRVLGFVDVRIGERPGNDLYSIPNMEWKNVSTGRCAEVPCGCGVVQTEYSSTDRTNESVGRTAST